MGIIVLHILCNIAGSLGETSDGGIEVRNVGLLGHDADGRRIIENNDVGSRVWE